MYNRFDRTNKSESKLFELPNETLVFLDEKGWKTIYPKRDLDLLTYHYNIMEYAILEKI